VCSALERCSSAVTHQLAGREKVAMHIRGLCTFTFCTLRTMRGMIRKDQEQHMEFSRSLRSLRSSNSI